MGKQFFEHITNKICERFDFLFKLNYQIKEKNFEYKWSSISQHEDLLFILTNPQINRDIRIIFIPINDTGARLDNFGITIWDNKNMITIWDNKNMKHIEIDNYMKLYHKDEYKELSLRSFEGTFEEKLDQLLDYVVNIMQKYLLEVLEGKKWIKVPMDWGGAK